MSVTRLSGGLTPADGTDPRTFPTIWNATAGQIETAQGNITSLQGETVSQGSRLDVVEGDVSTLQGVTAAQGSAISVLEGRDLDSLSDVALGTALVDGQVLAYSTAIPGWTNATAAGGGGGGLSEIIYYTSNATWTKADYPGLRAIRVKVQGAGGGGGNHGGSNTGASGGGAGVGCGAGGAASAWCGRCWWCGGGCGRSSSP